MTNTPGNGWPGGPPPQGPGSTPPGWGAQPWNPSAPPPRPGQQPAPLPYAPPPSGFDPTRAMGEAPPQPVSINQFSPPPNRTPVIATIAALVILVLVIAVGTYLRAQPAAPTPSPSVSQTASAGPGHPFTTPTGQGGRWQILDEQWTDEGLQLQLRIHSDSGSISFSFLAFANATTQVVEPTAGSMTPDIRNGTATPAQPVTGYVFFPLPREDATIILATGSGRQMSALPVKG